MLEERAGHGTVYLLFSSLWSGELGLTICTIIEVKTSLAVFGRGKIYELASS